jgi:hypothetical protein
MGGEDARVDAPEMTDTQHGDAQSPRAHGAPVARASSSSPRWRNSARSVSR